MTRMIAIDTPSAKLEFPADTPIADIRAAIGEYAKTPEARQSALAQWADQHVAIERQGGGKSTIGDAIRNFASGTPIGSWLDEANAATASLMGQAPYDEAKAYQNAMTRAVDQDTGLMGTATKVAGGIASVPLAPAAQVMRGATMVPQMANAAVTGGLYGLLYGAGEGDGLAERGMNALQGGAIGTTLGGLAVPTAKGVANAVGYVADKFKGIPAALNQFEPGAVRRVSRSVGDDVANNAAIPGLARQYGPEGMIADIGANTRSQVGAVARTPGEGKSIALNRLNARAEGAGGRIRSELDNALGPEINLPQAVDAIDRSASQQARPFYEQFRNTPIPFTRELENIVSTLKNEPSVLRDARRLANLDDQSGPRQFFANIANDGTVSIERVPNAAEWDYIKRALDGLAYSAGASKNDKRIYGGLSSKIKSQIDNLLSPGDPAQSIWAQGRAISGEGTRLTEALGSGRTAFNRGISPDEMGAELAGMQSQGERLAYTLGGRQNIRDVMGNASTKWGANDDTAARKMLGSDYARQKLEILAGPANANRLTGRLDTETAFDATREAARGNSITAAATAAQKEFPNVVDKVAVSREVGAQSLTGLGLRGVRALTDALTGGAMSERQAAIARDAARMLTAQGAGRDDIATGLMRYRNSQGMTQNGKQAIDRLLQVLLPGPRQVLIDERTR